MPAQHGAGRAVNRRDAHRYRTHDETWSSLVTAAEKDCAINRMRTQQLLRLHCEEISVEHCRRFHEWFGQRNRRQLEREPAGLEHAAFDVFDTIAQMGVALVDIGPRVDDADGRPAAPILEIIADLAQARAMAEGPEIVDTEPAVRPQLPLVSCALPFVRSRQLVISSVPE